MLQQLKDKIPSFDRLLRRLSVMIVDPSISLGSIYSEILGHIVGHYEVIEEEGNYADCDLERDPASISLDAINFIIRDLPVSRENCERIIDYLKTGYPSWDGYNRLITEFSSVLDSSELKALITEGRSNFDAGSTAHWTEDTSK